MIAQSFPLRSEFAFPNGIKLFAGSISPRTPESFLCIKKTTGSGVRSAVLIKPFTSHGRDGTASESPAVCAKSDSSAFEWCAPPRATPDVARITSGTGCPNMNRIFAA